MYLASSSSLRIKNCGQCALFDESRDLDICSVPPMTSCTYIIFHWTKTAIILGALVEVRCKTLTDLDLARDLFLCLEVLHAADWAASAVTAASNCINVWKCASSNSSSCDQEQEGGTYSIHLFPVTQPSIACASSNEDNEIEAVGWQSIGHQIKTFSSDN